MKLAITQWQVGRSKTNEPGCLKENLQELSHAYPLLNLLTGDAIFLQRPLLEVLQSKGCGYLFQVKANQQETQEALKTCFADDRIGLPKAESVDQKGGTTRYVVLGTIWTMPNGYVIR